MPLLTGRPGYRTVTMLQYRLFFAGTLLKGLGRLFWPAVTNLAMKAPCFGLLESYA